MGKREKNIIARRLVHSYLSSIISISLVLLLVGFFALLAVNARSVSNYFKENIRISLVLSGNTEEARALQIDSAVQAMPQVKITRYISKEQGTREMKELLGEDFLDVFQTNPIPISIEVQLKADYFSEDSIGVFKRQLADIGGIDEVLYENSVIETINSNIERIGFIVLVFILLLLFISFVLINNTVRLNVYSKRFSIYTMRLVGATKAFIRAPFLIKAVFQGFISGLCASCILVALLYVVREQFEQLFAIFDINLLVAVLAGTVVLGVLICLVCTFFVMNRLVSLSNDELYY